MSKKVFVSYSHRQSDWVLNRLAPCLKAGGATVLLDVEQFKAGQTVIGQMDGLQDQADVSVLVLTDTYLASDYCRHEMSRALARDPGFVNGTTIPVKRADCQLPPDIATTPLWVNLTNDKDAAQWDLLLAACGADLGAEAPHWLEVRQDLLRALHNRESVNLVVTGQPKAKEMIDQLEQLLDAPRLGRVNLYSNQTATRPELVKALLDACGLTMPVPVGAKDLGVLETAIFSKSLSRVALLHMDMIQRRPDYDVDLFSSLRYLAEERKLVMLAQSRKPLSVLLPPDHPLSSFIPKVVELNGRKR